MSTIRAEATTTASTASLVDAAAAATGFETHPAGQETSFMEEVLMTVVFLGLLGATVALALSTVTA
jgi:hypothetical protein